MLQHNETSCGIDLIQVAPNLEWEWPVWEWKISLPVVLVKVVLKAIKLRSSLFKLPRNEMGRRRISTDFKFDR